MVTIKKRIQTIFEARMNAITIIPFSKHRKLIQQGMNLQELQQEWK